MSAWSLGGRVTWSECEKISETSRNKQKKIHFSCEVLWKRNPLHDQLKILIPNKRSRSSLQPEEGVIRKIPWLWIPWSNQQNCLLRPKRIQTIQRQLRMRSKEAKGKGWGQTGGNSVIKQVLLPSPGSYHFLSVPLPLSPRSLPSETEALKTTPLLFALHP